MKPAVFAYLSRLDAHLAGVGDPRERIRLIDDERHRVDRPSARSANGPPREDDRAPRFDSPPSTSPCCTANSRCAWKPRAKPLH